MGGHFSLLVSRPVWYAASSATAGSPVLSLDSDPEPWDFSAPSEHVCCKVGVQRILAKFIANKSSNLKFLPSGKLAVVGSYIIGWLVSRVKLALWCVVQERNRKVVLVFIQAWLRVRCCCYLMSSLAFAAASIPVLWHVGIGMNVNTSGMGVWQGRNIMQHSSTVFTNTSGFEFSFG